MKPAEQLVVQYGHSSDAQLPVHERIALYRALAVVSKSDDMTAHFFQCADDLAAAEQKIGQLLLNFRRKA